MIKYDPSDNKVRHDLKNQLIENAISLGGKNHFFSLIEAIRIAHPHPLMAKDASFRFKKGLIKWEKVIYKDKVNLLLALTKNSDGDKYLMSEKGNRNYKIVRNLMRTIGPIKFEVRPKNIKDGEGFIFKLIEIIDENTCRLSFMFEVLFILPINLIKKIYIAPKKII